MCVLCITEFMHGVISGGHKRKMGRRSLRLVLISTMIFGFHGWHHLYAAATYCKCSRFVGLTL